MTVTLNEGATYDVERGNQGNGCTQSAVSLSESYPGGKSKVADMVWERLGDVDNFVEPFAGSLAVLLRRPAEHFRDGASLRLGVSGRTPWPKT